MDGDPEDHRNRTLSLPPLGRAVVIAGGLTLLAMLALLGLQLAVLKDSRRHIAAQDAKVTRLLDASSPLLRQSPSLVKQLRKRAAPLLRQLGRSDLAGAID